MTPIDRLCMLYPEVPRTVIKTIITSMKMSLRFSMSHNKNSPHRIIIIHNFGKFYVATEATHRRGHKIVSKQKIDWARTVGKRRQEKKRQLEIKWLMAKQR